MYVTEGADGTLSIQGLTRDEYEEISSALHSTVSTYYDQLPSAKIAEAVVPLEAILTVLDQF